MRKRKEVKAKVAMPQDAMNGKHFFEVRDDHCIEKAARLQFEDVAVVSDCWRWSCG
jgi:hypothetical protein